MASLDITGHRKTSLIGLKMEDKIHHYFAWLLIFISLTGGITFAGEPKKVQVVADFSSIATSMNDDPHQSGYAVTIYEREDGLLFGDFTFATGSTEGVGGKLIELMFKNGQLSFKTKTSAYETANGPSRELFEFTGKVSGILLIGTLKIRDGYRPKSHAIIKKIVLKRVDSAYPLSYETHQAIFAKDPW